MNNIDIDFIRNNLGTEELLLALKLDIEAFHQDGYGVGKTWKDSYRPGGPINFGPAKPHESEEVKILMTHVSNCHFAWLNGFDEAMKARKKGL